MSKVSQYDGVMVLAGGRYERVDKGGLVPDNADADHVQVLEDRGLVAEGEPFAGLVASTSGPVAFNVDDEAEAAKKSGGVKARAAGGHVGHRTN